MLLLHSIFYGSVVYSSSREREREREREVSEAKGDRLHCNDQSDENVLGDDDEVRDTDLEEV